jgi:hypothetical protein
VDARIVWKVVGDCLVTVAQVTSAPAAKISAPLPWVSVVTNA